MATNNKTVMEVSENIFQGNIISNNQHTFSERMYQEYEEAKKVGFSGTYEEYLQLRDFT